MASAGAAGLLIHVAVGSGGRSGTPKELGSLLLLGCRETVVDGVRGHQAQRPVGTLGVVPGKEALAEHLGILVHRAQEPGDVPAPNLVGARREQLGLVVRRVSELMATLADFRVRREHPVHRADRPAGPRSASGADRRTAPPSRRSNVPTAPAVVHASASFKMRRLYSAVYVRRRDFAATYTFSCHYRGLPVRGITATQGSAHCEPPHEALPELLWVRPMALPHRERSFPPQQWAVHETGSTTIPALLLLRCV